MNPTQPLNKILAITLLTIGVSALSANAMLIPMSNLSSVSNTFECSVTALRTNVTIGTNDNVQAMIYADTGPNAAPLVTTNGIPILVINLKVGEMFICHFTNGLPASSMDNLATIHWHGIELDNDSDGTAATQDAITPGENYTYRFIPSRPGLYWFHNHINPGSSTFAGMYGLIIVPNNIEPSLIASNTLPAADYTYSLGLSDIEFNPTNGFVGKFLQDTNAGNTTPTNWYSINELGDLCHKFAIGDPSGNTLACNVATLPGTTVLVNGATPTTNLAGLYPLYVVPSGQRVRLHLLNEASSRDFRLSLLYPDPVRTGDRNLYRIGGQGGLLNNIRLEGGIQGAWDTKYNLGEIVMGSGQRADVLIYPTGTNGDIIQLVGNNLPAPFNLSGTATGSPGFPTNYPVAYFQISGSVTNYSQPTNGEPILANTVEYVQNLKTNTVLNTLAPVPTGWVGTTNPTMVLQTGTPPGYSNNSPSINGFPYGQLDANMGDGEFIAHIPTNPPTARYAHVGDLLELSVSNSSGAVHPYHLHGFSMQPVRIIKNATTNSPATTLYNFDYNEFIDTMEVYGGQTYVFRTRLEDRPKLCDETTSTPGPILAPCTGDSSSGGLAGRWIYHCHIFLHVGLGMISEIDVLPETTPVKILNVAPLSGGGIQFTFDVPAGTNYSIEASANLTSWQTNATGVGQVGGESYTNAAGSNTVQFYRIKL
ncbi:MAG TPA: multicopper oxidase family protein [Verrucomicrobiae bacterium]|nr:multicopper oxidase family protein [Verrucomicrobiae bacterium]